MTTTDTTTEHELTVDPDDLTVYDRSVEDIAATVLCPGCEEPLDGTEIITDEFTFQRGPGWYELTIRATVPCDCGALVHLIAEAADCADPLPN